MTTSTIPVPGQPVAFDHRGHSYIGRITLNRKNIQLEDTSYIGVDEVTNLRPAIPVPVDVLRKLLEPIKWDATGMPVSIKCPICDTEYYCTPTCPIPALREAVEKAEER